MVEAPASIRQGRAYRSQLRITEAAKEIIGGGGWAALTISAVASKAGVSVGLVCRYFPTRDHFALALYEQLADALAGRAADLPAGPFAARFVALVRWKLELLEPHRDVLVALAGAAIDPSTRVGVLGAGAQRVRAKVAGLFDLAVRGATDAPEDESAARLARLLYAAHLALVLLWVQLPPGHALPLDAFEGSGAAIGPLLELAALRLDGTLRALLGAPTAPDDDAKAAAVLELVLRRQRLLDEPGGSADAASMRALHEPVIQSMMDRGAPIQIVLPAFPAKAPNPRKVLGKLPDMAEWLALQGLAELLDEIRAVYAPGAELVVCSDGGVFADLVGVSDADVRAYRTALEAMIARIAGPTRIRVFDLEDALGGGRAASNRAALMARYGGTEAALRARAESSAATARMIDGVHRFLFEDEIVRSAGTSRTQVRKATRARAYEVVLRSEAWGALVASAFPGALRLSIHPQPPVSSKLGVHLLETEDPWLTPWHGAAVLVGERYTLMHRSDAEAMGAEPRRSEDGLAYLEVPS
ncbi:MAG: L-tyrosine/L-tryptophan isonitrile synthase family protein [Polyangiaceae bacterium]